MNDVKALSPLIQKRTEGVQRYIFQLRQDNIPSLPEEKYKFVENGNPEHIIEKDKIEFD